MAAFGTTPTTRQGRRKRSCYQRQRRRRRISMKRRAVPEGSRRVRRDGILRRVRTLKRLVPNAQSMGLEGLFRETADYIMWLEMSVEVMKSLLNPLSPCDFE